jgi:hypothetical protein
MEVITIPSARGGRASVAVDGGAVVGFTGGVSAVCGGRTDVAGAVAGEAVSSTSRQAAMTSKPNNKTRKERRQVNG